LESGPVREAADRRRFTLYFCCATVADRLVPAKCGKHGAVARLVSIVGRSGAAIGKKRKVAPWHPPLFAMRNLNVDKDARCEFAKAGSIARRCWCLDAAVPSQGRSGEGVPGKSWMSGMTE